MSKGATSLQTETLGRAARAMRGLRRAMLDNDWQAVGEAVDALDATHLKALHLVRTPSEGRWVGPLSPPELATRARSALQSADSAAPLYDGALSSPLSDDLESLDGDATLGELIGHEVGAAWRAVTNRSIDRLALFTTTVVTAMDRYDSCESALGAFSLAEGPISIRIL